MKDARFDRLTEVERGWIDAVLDGSIDETEFEKLQDRMLERPELRAVMRRTLAAHHGLRKRAEPADSAAGAWLAEEAAAAKIVTLPPTIRAAHRFPTALVAGLAFLLGLALMHFGRSPVVVERPVVSPPATNASPPVVEAQGFAVLAQTLDAQWAAGEAPRRPGDNLGAEVLRLRSGLAEVQFFSGATLVAQGPAVIALTSAWEAECRAGIVRLRVPPAARGFTLRGPVTEIVDLGTEFGLEVKDGRARVEVLDGEIALRHRDGPERVVVPGTAWNLPSDGAASTAPGGGVSFPELTAFALRTKSQHRVDFERWLGHRRAFARDKRVIAYYTFDRDQPAAAVPSLAGPHNRELDGTVILAETADGRWPGMKQALEFRRPGARVRVRIPGKFRAFTFAAWVRIDSLDRRYNALFMGDGYETGEPHWQIRDDGRLMLSVMVDDSRPSVYRNDRAGFHYVYFSPPIWDRTMNGQWMHLVSVFDPANRRVSHYVNGRRISRENIADEHRIDTLLIGNGEIGNWGEPFRKTPRFAIRNLNGRIDELAILNAALTDSEVEALHRKSQASNQ